jgi:hypothetical protein
LSGAPAGTVSEVFRRADDVPRLVGWGTLAYDAHRRGRPASAANAQPWSHIDLMG